MKLIELSFDLVEGGVEIFRLFWYDCRPNLAKTAWLRDA